MEMKILVAEDNPDDVVLLQHAVERAKVRSQLSAVSDGVEALAYLQGEGTFADRTAHRFRVFERLHGARYPGTGIGLSIVRKGVERMGGRLGLESEPGKGTLLWIELPSSKER